MVDEIRDGLDAMIWLALKDEVRPVDFDEIPFPAGAKDFGRAIGADEPVSRGPDTEDGHVDFGDLGANVAGQDLPEARRENAGGHRAHGLANCGNQWRRCFVSGEEKLDGG